MPTRSPAPPRPRWRPADHLRGAALALALLAHGIYAIPFPSRITEADLAEGKYRQDLVLWGRILGGVGLEVGPEQLGPPLVAVTTTLSQVERALKRPLRPVFRLTNTNQAWALFAGATMRPERIVVERRDPESGEWIPLQRRLDPCCNWREDAFRYRRLRGIWDNQKKKERPGYRHIAEWAARGVFEDFPDTREARIYLERARTTYPWKPPDPELEVRHLRWFHRSRFDLPGAPPDREPAP